ncbi:MAG TPA: NAD-dependent epimerase/dehydratase family protein [Devosiaceae bacterium]
MRYFITGTAGFIGFHLARRLLAEGHQVTGYDGFTDYYDVTLKRARHAELKQQQGFTEIIGRLEDMPALITAVQHCAPQVIVHLAAQAGVRYSIENPRAYVESNSVGSFNLLEAARAAQPQHLLLASTSSVYGANPETPFSEGQRVGCPVSLYAATKIGMEAMAHAYAHLHAIPTTAFRFFTVYGPWGRPDMALFKFVSAILGGRPIDVYGNGRMRRDFTYIDDLVEAVIRLADAVPQAGLHAGGPEDTISPVAPYRVVNIAGGQPVELLDFISAVEHALGRKAERNLMPMQQGDVVETHADPGLLHALTGYLPGTSIDEGVSAFVSWYRHYHSI